MRIIASLGEALITLYAAAGLVPPASFAVIWAASFGLTRDNKKAARIAVHTTTILLVGADLVLLRAFLHSAFLLWLYVLVVLLGVGLIGRKQFERTGEVQVFRLAKAASGFSFLVLSAAYVLLVLSGIVRYVING